MRNVFLVVVGTEGMAEPLARTVDPWQSWTDVRAVCVQIIDKVIDRQE